MFAWGLFAELGKFSPEHRNYFLHGEGNFENINPCDNYKVGVCFLIKKLYSFPHPNTASGLQLLYFRYTAVGGTVFSPILFYWYSWLDKVYPGVQLKTVLKKVREGF